MCLRFLGRDGAVGISRVFWGRSTLVQVFTWKVKKSGAWVRIWRGIMEMSCGKESAYMTISHIISTNSWINGGVWWCSGMIFARPCRHFDGILGIWGRRIHIQVFTWKVRKSGAWVRIWRCIGLIMERSCGKERATEKKRTWRVLTWRFHTL